MSKIIINNFDQPYPLRSNFKKIVIPIIVLLIFLIGLIMAFSSRLLTKNIYLEISERRSTSISKALKNTNEQAWEALQISSSPKQFLYSLEGAPLLDTLRSEVTELGLSHLKIYGKNALLLYSSEEEQIGDFDISAGYLNAIKGVNSLVNKLTPEGVKLYELYVRVPNNKHNTIMELYEPISYLDKISKRAIVPASLIPMLVLILITWIMMQLVNKAQFDISYRNRLLLEFREKLQKLVSKEAVSSLKTSVGEGEVKSKRIKATILFSDIRGFTSYCENEDPNTVVSFLNDSLGTVIDAVNKEGGDIDKIIGDAVLAFFQGEGSEKRALNSALAAMDKMNQRHFPRKIGIGIYTGEVVIGTIGVASRMDFTMIGDTVNIASRLCSEADIGEIIIDDQSFSHCTYNKKYRTEKIQVKGRKSSLGVIKILPYSVI